MEPYPVPRWAFDVTAAQSTCGREVALQVRPEALRLSAEAQWQSQHARAPESRLCKFQEFYEQVIKQRHY